MPRIFRDLPPDHPLFTRGVSFVLRSDPPEEQDESEHEQPPEPDEQHGK